MSSKEPRAPVDWERIESFFRAGLLSVREIASANGVSHTAIQKRAKAEGWDRNLNAKIQAKAEALVAKREVAKQVATATTATERMVVEANALAIAEVRNAHRADIGRFKRLALDLLRELEAETGDPELFEQLGDILRAEDDKGQDRRNDVYRRVISSAGRVDSMKKLAETLRILIGLEREAYGIVDVSAPTNSAADVLKELVEHLPD